MPTCRNDRGPIESHLRSSKTETRLLVHAREARCQAIGGGNTRYRCGAAIAAMCLMGNANGNLAPEG